MLQRPSADSHQERHLSRPEIFTTLDAFRQWRRSLTPSTRIGFVPTMGALHEGHGTLLARLRPLCDISILSIFVNPKQFGPQEDLAKYPRTLEGDIALAQVHGVDAIFAPSNEDFYPPGFSTSVEETMVSRPLCGAARPGHFNGVTTVVLKLFHLVRPQLALFGLKDAQQFLVLNKMVQDLGIDVDIRGVPTVRENDGLALSSRNRYLSPPERAMAPMLYKCLRETAEKLQERPDAACQPLISQAHEQLLARGFQVQYLELRRLPDLALLETAPQKHQPALLAVAAHLGSTRLIDNVILHPEFLESLGIQTLPSHP